MTNEMIIFKESQKLMNDGILQGSGVFATVEFEDGARQVEMPEEIHTFQAWKSLGYSVKKGEKAIAKFPSRETVERVRKSYPIGTRIELVSMDDVQAPPIGTKGTVKGVDDTASLLVNWDNGSSLNVIYGEDEVKKVDL